MVLNIRKYFPALIPFIFLVALIPAVQFSKIPPADFTFCNATEPQSLDPAKVTGAPEGRIINALFEGLYRQLPDPDNPANMKPFPAMASGHTLSEDKRTYTFQIRQGAKWSDGSPVTAHDWTFSWQRFLHPETASEYSYQLWYVKNARKYTSSSVEVGDRVEIELDDRPNPTRLYPRGTILSAVVTKIEEVDTGEFDDEGKEMMAQIFTVDQKNESNGKVDWESEGTTKVYTRFSTPDFVAENNKAQKVRQLLLHFDEVGIKALDDENLEVTLESPTPYFLELVAFYPMYPVNRKCIEEHGDEEWMKVKNIVNNGPFLLEFRRLRDRIRFKKNPNYWDAENVKINTIDALAVQADTTILNMYMSGQTDWGTTVPNPLIKKLQERDELKKETPGRENEKDDLLIAPMLSTYFYRINVNRPPLDDPRVRRAINLAINKQEIVDFVTKAGQIPARSYVPPGITGYKSSEGGSYDPEKARQLLAEAGFPGGKGMRKIEILYNTSEGHRDIAEVIQSQLKENLEIDVSLLNLEWGTFLDTTSKQNYDIARAGWIADYPDPNTFLDMFVTDGDNNQTGWSNEKYDKLIYDAMEQEDPDKRMQMLSEAEAILMEEQPIAPIYFYVSLNIVRPYVKNFYPNIQDLHPLHILEIDKEQKEKILTQEGIR